LSPADVASHPFPRLRWAALLWLVVWGPTYAVVYGFGNFLHLCDVAVILTCVGLWRGSPLLLSMQALNILIDLAWDLDLGWRLATGRHLLGGTEYMWETKYPLWVRLLSLFHLLLPVVVLWALRRVGYDRRALAAQSVLGLVLIAGARALGPEVNVNYAWLDPFFHRSWGPAPLHVLVIFAGLIAVVYVPAHALLSRVCPATKSRGDTTRG
jgi:hypothetical protein